MEVSDIVLDSKLETRFHKNYVCHIYNESNNSTGQRAIQRREYWQRKKHLNTGGFGVVWLEQCIKGGPDGALRVVKEVQRPRGKFDCNRELEAIAKFSHAKVIYYLVLYNTKYLTSGLPLVFAVFCKIIRMV